MKKIGVILLGCCLGALLSASVATAGPRGECNRILAKEVGQAEKIHNGVDTAASCVDLASGLVEFIDGPKPMPLGVANLRGRGRPGAGLFAPGRAR